MQLQTIVNIEQPFAEKINYKSKIIMLGSCFTSNIGELFAANKFDVCVNPFGAIYNPASIAQSIDFLIQNATILDSDLCLHNGLWYNFAYHTSFSDVNKNAALKKMNDALNIGANYISTANFIIITLGTSYAYKYKKTNKIVNNCHKLPSAEFEKNLLELDEISSVLCAAVDNLRKINATAKFIFTVSPIRHLSDGAHQNQLSKARLLLATEMVCNTKQNCAYFPSYEIMMDQLRDYRFYADDMLHPSKLAIDYIWQLFASVFIDNESQQIMEDLKNILAAKAHKPLNINAEEYIKFKKTFLNRTKQMQAKYPYINLDEEIKFFEY